MPFSVVVGGVVRHVAFCTAPGQVSSNKRDWQCINITGGTTISSTAVLTNLDDMMSTGLKDLMSQDTRYYGSLLYYQTPTPPAPRPDSTIANQGFGTQDPGIAPTQCSGLISLYSAELGKPGQGRLYAPFPPAVDLEADGTPSAAYLANLTNLKNQLIAPRNIIDGAITGTFVPVLYVPGGSPPKRILTGIVRTSWATQRRRGFFGKANSNPF